MDVPQLKWRKPVKTETEIVIPMDEPTTATTAKKYDKCESELVAFKYKTATYLKTKGLSTKNPTTYVPSSSIEEIEHMLINNTNAVSKGLPWNRLDKMQKLTKITEYTTRYAEENDLSNEQRTKLLKYLQECINKKRLTKSSEVLYDKDTETILEIYGLIYVDGMEKYTIRIAK